MRHLLTPHPDTPSPAVARIEAEAARLPPGLLTLRYRLFGSIGAIRVPAPAAPARADGLWQQTCFEAFLRAGDRPAYYEINLSPSTEWAAYGFDGHRQGMRPAALASLPRIGTQVGADSLELHASLDLGGLDDLPDDLDWRIGLAAVIEDDHGRRSFWALGHPPGEPDFHHRDCLRVELPAARRP